jgi:hypothetical protein
MPDGETKKYMRTYGLYAGSGMSMLVIAYSRRLDPLGSVFKWTDPGMAHRTEWSEYFGRRNNNKGHPTHEG